MRENAFSRWRGGVAECTVARMSTIVAECLGDGVRAEEIPAEASLVELGLDSVSALTLIEAVEEAFEVTIPDEDISMELFGSVATLQVYVTGLAARKPERGR